MRSLINENVRSKFQFESKIADIHYKILTNKYLYFMQLEKRCATIGDGSEILIGFACDDGVL